MFKKDKITRLSTIAHFSTCSSDFGTSLSPRTHSEPTYQISAKAGNARLSYCDSTNFQYCRCSPYWTVIFARWTIPAKVHWWSEDAPKIWQWCASQFVSYCWKCISWPILRSSGGPTTKDSGLQSNQEKSCSWLIPRFLSPWGPDPFTFSTQDDEKGVKSYTCRKSPMGGKFFHSTKFYVCR